MAPEDTPRDDGTDREVSGYLARLVDPDRLRAYLATQLDAVDDEGGDDAGTAAGANPFSVERFGEGHSNETLLVSWGGRELVVRRPPPGETAERAHDVLREYRVMDALQDTPVPVPRTLLACEDDAVLGAEFYVMERVAGDVLRSEEPERLTTPDHRERLGEGLVDALAAIHAVDPAAVGLEEFGYPDGFTERQVRRWGEQLTWAFDRTAEEREVPALYDTLSWLTDNVPSDPPSGLVHGDFKLDNVVVAPGTPPEVAAVLDWELSTLGDPLTDLGWFLAHWRDPGDPPAISELDPTFTEREGYSTRRQLVERYEAATGIEYEHDRFYRTLAVFKLAALGEMFFRRHLEGNADDDLYPQMREGVPALGERATRIIDGDEPL
ncbi:phosphotransferase family protein [Halobium salinum]|uniref:Phosphotransferase family protein n=1 Tax=Halobium salinum TaxID=1364940 RepID=A0ABD5PDQ6_9EURY|nr:phosphotransferase family protein [Halobium salinum]